MSTTTAVDGRVHPRSDHGLTTQKLYRFGAIIVGLVVLLTAVSLVGSRSQTSSLEDKTTISELKSQLQLADMMHDAIRASVYGSGLGDTLGSDAVAAFASELDERITVFQDAIDAAAALPVSTDILGLIEAARGPLDEYATSSTSMLTVMPDLASPDATTAAAARELYDVWNASFFTLETSLEQLGEEVEVESARIVEDASSTSSRSELTILLGAVFALAVFVVVWRKVLASVARMHQMQSEMARVTSMMDNNPTNTMFVDTDLVIRYLNDASVRTLRSIQHLLPVKVDQVVGSSVDIFHKNPAHQRSMLADPDRYLPHTAVIPLGDEFMELNVSAIRDTDGTYIGSMAAWSLVTEKLRVEAEAAEMNRREREAVDALQAKVDSLSKTLSLAASGDLTARIDVTGDDAIGQMAGAVGKLLGDLRGSVQAIAVNSEALAAAAEELQVVSSQMGSNSAETSRQVGFVSEASVEVSRSVETVSAASEEMSASIKEIARNAAEAAKVATQAVEAARVTNDTVAKLGDSSIEIGLIVKVITGIAQQTNLLALNATIEAARAGEAGKGFAVVANEVKELAKETAKATEDISAKIEAIQSDTQSSVDSITGILSIIDQIAEFQDTIASAVEEQAATTSEIARSVTDASRGSTEITANMHTVARAADNTASGASDSSRAASELARMASDLQQLVGQFTY